MISDDNFLSCQNYVMVVMLLGIRSLGDQLFYSVDFTVLYLLTYDIMIVFTLSADLIMLNFVSAHISFANPIERDMDSTLI